ncbi:delta-12 fatty acid desaturas-like protein [Viridothelium virens]|uniref:Delta-12 fatty acid desaturas-like protein n=1 Tax=Viridothelium virens TaxID=1048519 RepID=A0A6A6H571_VIRVR|nr:delta-12 fatty acid desaturas-like protein [Viridothelium virens]
MALNYNSHPAEVAAKDGPSDIRIDELKKAIPPRCFKSSYIRSSFSLFQDMALAILIMRAAFLFVPQIQSVPVRWLAWAFYGWIEGLIFTGLWVLAHECGHGALFPSKYMNNFFGFVLHSALMVPYFSWQSTHRRHHLYANNMNFDHNYVPPRESEYFKTLWSKVQRVEDLAEDVPAQLLGMPTYLLTNITASPTSLHRPKSKRWLGNGHLDPTGSLFRPEEAYLVLCSDLGLVAMAAALYFTGRQIGSGTTMLLYLQPYFWVNHWFVAITYLHHTHPDLPKYEPEAWNFVKGATATVDREFGPIGRYLFHGIIEFHVVHHLFPHIPFYHREEATQAIIPVLGDAYHCDKDRRFLPGLWESFTKCQYVEADEATSPKDQALWYKSGPSPPPEYSMTRKGWLLKIW